MILSAQSIRRLCIWSTRQPHVKPLIRPFWERTKWEGKTFGLSAAGYDVRIQQDIWLWPFWGRLASTVEEFHIPNNLVMRVHDKSTWARKFVLVQNTVAEPGWNGFLTLELTRMLPWPVRIKAGTPIAQVIFEMLDEPTEQPYDGKYQDQPPWAVAAIQERS